MRLETGYEERRARIEMVPLMDVVFLLLVYFIYAMFTMSVHRGVRVELPGGPAPREAGERLVIVLQADGRLQFAGRDRTRDDLLLEVVGRYREHPVPVLISADRRAELGAGIELLARLKDAGVTTVAFQVEGPTRGVPDRGP